MIKFWARWRKTIQGTVLVLAGVLAALLTAVESASGNFRLTRIFALASLGLLVLIAIFVVPPLFRSARRENSLPEFPFQFTRGGSIFVAMILIVAFAAWNTGNNLLFLVFSLLLSTLFVGWTAGRSSLRELMVSARFPDHIYAGEPAQVTVTLRNKKWLLPSFSILVETASSGQEMHLATESNRARKPVKRTVAYFQYLPRKSQGQQRVEQTFERRGRVVISGFELSTRFPFNFIRSKNYLRARDVALTVYPKPEPVSDELHLLPIEKGRLASSRRGPGHELRTLRNYHPRDDMRHIDWKASARSRNLIVREFTSEEERRVTIALDTLRPHVPPDDYEARFERGVTIAASLVKHFIEERSDVCLTAGAEKCDYGSGQEHLHACLRVLATVTPRENGTPESAALPLTGVRVSDFSILITTANPGSIHSAIWRQSHVIHV